MEEWTSEGLLDLDAIDNLTDAQVDTILDLLTKAGY
jgi:hypothetical protein